MGERIGRRNNSIQLLLKGFCRSVCSLCFLRLSRQKQVEIGPFHTSVDEMLLLDSFDRYSLWLYFNRKEHAGYMHGASSLIKGRATGYIFLSDKSSCNHNTIALHSIEFQREQRLTRI